MLSWGTGSGFRQIGGSFRSSGATFQIDALKPPISSETYCRRSVTDGRWQPMPFADFIRNVNTIGVSGALTSVNATSVAVKLLSTKPTNLLSKNVSRGCDSGNTNGIGIGADVTLTTDSSNQYSGTRCLKVVNAQGGDSGAIWNDPLTVIDPSKTYTAQFKVKGECKVQLFFNLYTSGMSFLDSFFSSEITPTGTYQTISRTVDFSGYPTGYYADIVMRPVYGYTGTNYYDELEIAQEGSASSWVEGGFAISDGTATLTRTVLLSTTSRNYLPTNYANGFETGTPSNYTQDGGATITADTDKYSGTYAIKFVGSDANWITSSTHYATTPGDVWSASARIKLPSGSCCAYFCLHWWDSGNSYIGETYHAFANTSYEWRYITAAAPANTAYVSMGLRGRGSVVDNTYLDELQLEKGSTPTPWGSPSFVAPKAQLTTSATATIPITISAHGYGVLTVTNTAKVLKQCVTILNQLTRNQATGTDFYGTTDGFTAGSNSSVSSSTDYAYQGTRSVKVVTNGVGLGEGVFYYQQGITGQLYTMSIRIKGTNGTTLKLRLGNDQQHDTSITLDGTWQSYSVSGASNVDYWYITTTGTIQATTFYVDQLQLEKFTGLSWQEPYNAILTLTASIKQTIPITIGKNTLTSNIATGTDTLSSITGFEKTIGTETLASTTSEYYQGGRSLKVTTVNSAYTGVYTWPDTYCLTNRDYVASLYVKCPTGHGNIYYQITNSGGTTLNYAETSPTGAWQQLTLTANSGSTTGLRIVVGYVSAPGVIDFYVDQIQLEEGTVATPWEKPKSISVALTSTNANAKATKKLVASSSALLSTSAVQKTTCKLVASTSALLTTSAVQKTTCKLASSVSCLLTPTANIRATWKAIGSGLCTLTTTANIKETVKIISSATAQSSTSAVQHTTLRTTALLSGLLTTSAIPKQVDKLVSAVSMVLVPTANIKETIKIVSSASGALTSTNATIKSAQKASGLANGLLSVTNSKLSAYYWKGIASSSGQLSTSAKITDYVKVVASSSGVLTTSAIAKQTDKLGANGVCILTPTNNNIVATWKASDKTNLFRWDQATARESNGFTATTNASVSITTSEQWEGTTSLKIDTTGSGANEGLTSKGMSPYNYTVISAGDYTFSVYLKGSGTVKLWIEERDISHAIIGSTSSLTKTLTSSWTRYDVTRTITTGVRLDIVVGTSTAQATTFYADGLQLEKGTTPSTFESPVVGLLTPTANIKKTIPISASASGVLTSTNAKVVSIWKAKAKWNLFTPNEATAGDSLGNITGFSGNIQLPTYDTSTSYSGLGSIKGIISLGDDEYFNTEGTDVTPNTTYTVQVTHKENFSNGTLLLGFYQYDSSWVYLGVTGWTTLTKSGSWKTESHTKTLRTDCYYVQIIVYRTGGALSGDTVWLDNLQLEEGSTATTWSKPALTPLANDVATKKLIASASGLLTTYASITVVRSDVELEASSSGLLTTSASAKQTDKLYITETGQLTSTNAFLKRTIPISASGNNGLLSVTKATILSLEKASATGVCILTPSAVAKQTDKLISTTGAGLLTSTNARLKATWKGVATGVCILTPSATLTFYTKLYISATGALTSTNATAKQTQRASGTASGLLTTTAYDRLVRPIIASSSGLLTTTANDTAIKKLNIIETGVLSSTNANAKKTALLIVSATGQLSTLANDRLVRPIVAPASGTLTTIANSVVYVKIVDEVTVALSTTNATLRATWHGAISETAHSSTSATLKRTIPLSSTGTGQSSTSAVIKTLMLVIASATANLTTSATITKVYRITSSGTGLLGVTNAYLKANWKAIGTAGGLCTTIANDKLIRPISCSTTGLLTVTNSNLIATKKLVISESGTLSILNSKLKATWSAKALTATGVLTPYALAQSLDTMVASGVCVLTSTNANALATKKMIASSSGLLVNNNAHIDALWKCSVSETGQLTVTKSDIKRIIPLSVSGSSLLTVNNANLKKTSSLVAITSGTLTTSATSKVLMLSGGSSNSVLSTVANIKATKLLIASGAGVSSSVQAHIDANWKGALSETGLLSTTANIKRTIKISVSASGLLTTSAIQHTTVKLISSGNGVLTPTASITKVYSITASSSCALTVTNANDTAIKRLSISETGVLSTYARLETTAGSQAHGYGILTSTNANDVATKRLAVAEAGILTSTNAKLIATWKGLASFSGLLTPSANITRVYSDSASASGTLSTSAPIKDIRIISASSTGQSSGNAVVTDIVKIVSSTSGTLTPTASMKTLMELELVATGELQTTATIKATKTLISSAIGQVTSTNANAVLGKILVASGSGALTVTKSNIVANWKGAISATGLLTPVSSITKVYSVSAIGNGLLTSVNANIVRNRTIIAGESGLLSVTNSKIVATWSAKTTAGGVSNGNGYIGGDIPLISTGTGVLSSTNATSVATKKLINDTASGSLTKDNAKAVALWKGLVSETGLLTVYSKPTKIVPLVSSGTGTLTTVANDIATKLLSVSVTTQLSTVANIKETIILSTSAYGVVTTSAGIKETVIIGSLANGTLTSTQSEAETLMTTSALLQSQLTPSSLLTKVYNVSATASSSLTPVATIKRDIPIVSSASASLTTVATLKSLQTTTAIGISYLTTSSNITRVYSVSTHGYGLLTSVNARFVKDVYLTASGTPHLIEMSVYAMMLRLVSSSSSGILTTVSNEVATKLLVVSGSSTLSTYANALLSGDTVAYGYGVLSSTNAKAIATWAGKTSDTGTLTPATSITRIYSGTASSTGSLTPLSTLSRTIEIQGEGTNSSDASVNLTARWHGYISETGQTSSLATTIKIQNTSSSANGVLSITNAFIHRDELASTAYASGWIHIATSYAKVVRRASCSDTASLTPNANIRKVVKISATGAGSLTPSAIASATDRLFSTASMSLVSTMAKPSALWRGIASSSGLLSTSARIAGMVEVDASAEAKLTPLAIVKETVDIDASGLGFLTSIKAEPLVNRKLIASSSSVLVPEVSITKITKISALGIGELSTYANARLLVEMVEIAASGFSTLLDLAFASEIIILSASCGCVLTGLATIREYRPVCRTSIEITVTSPKTILTVLDGDTDFAVLSPKTTVIECGRG